MAQAIYTKGKKPLIKNGRVVCIARDMNKKSEPWMEQVKLAAMLAYPDNEVENGPCILSAQFYFMRPKYHFGTGRNAGKVKASAPYCHAVFPDLSKLIRAIEDGITKSKVIWEDDSRICSYMDCRKKWTTEEERVEIQVYFQEGIQI